MKRFVLLSVLLVLVSMVALSVAAIPVAADLVADTTSITQTVEDGEDFAVTINFTNDGAVDLTDITFSPSVLATDNDDDEITVEFSPASIATLAGFSSVLVEATIDVENGYDSENGITGTIVATAATGETASIAVDLNVRPLACEEGDQGDLTISIDEPDNGDEFEQGETIDLEIEVDNDGEDDMDIVVEAILWNLDEQEVVGSVESDAEEIEEDESHTFDLHLEIDGEDVDEKDDYMLYVIAYDDDDEDDNCDTEDLEIELEEQSYYLVVEEVQVTPSAVSCGSPVQFATQVENRGAKDLDDVFVRIMNAVLGIDESSTVFELEEDDDSIVRQSILIPEDAEVGSYTFDVIGDYGEQDIETVTLQVVSCEAEEDVEERVYLTAEEDEDVSVAPTGPATTVQFDDSTIFDRLEAGQVPVWVWLVGCLVLATLIVILAIVAATSGGRRRR